MNINIESKDFIIKNVEEIKNKDITEICIHLRNYFDNIIYNEYKNKNNIELLEILSQLLPRIMNENHIIAYEYISFVNKTMFGQRILNKYSHIINLLPDTRIVTFFIDDSTSWTFPIYLFYINLINKKNITIDFDKLNIFFTNCFNNTDDRIYIDIVNRNIFNIKNILSTNTINNIITLSMKEHIPNKYILKRLKYLNKIVPNLKNYFSVILNHTLSPKKIDMLPKLMSFYYDFPISQKISYICDNIYYNHISSNNEKNLFLEIFDKLKTSEEKNLMIINYLFLQGSSFGKELIVDNMDTYVPLIKKKAFELIYKDPNVIKINSIEFRNMINKFGYLNFSKMISINKYISIFMLPYMVGINGKDAYKFNKIKYNISLFIRKIKNKKAIIDKIKVYSLNSSNKILDLPPYHIFPGQLQNFNNKQFLLKEKADGTLETSLPSDIEPKHNLPTKIKAEYIEDYDLYMVFDIDMPQLDIIQRQKFIFSSHEYGMNMTVINNIDELYKNIQEERLKLKEFLKKPYNNYRWYPKPAWIIENIENFIDPFISLIENDLRLIDSDTINYDGFILTPLDSSREIKIKPKKYYTIDLLYKNNKWYDRDNIEWDINHNDNHNDYNFNSIYRCYYNKDIDKYIAGEIRYDKKKPNTNLIATTIYNLQKCDYNVSHNNIYRQQNDNTKEWLDIINSNNNMIKTVINKINFNQINILDLGCGSGRLLKYINNFNNYLGIDMDINMLAKGINKYSKSLYSLNEYNNIMFSHADLNKNFDGWININQKYDYIFCINSIMHFTSDIFWDKIKSISKEKTIIIFNVVDMENNTRYDFMDNNFMERKDDIVYYKFPIHKEIKQEKYIDILNILNKYNWTIKETYKSTDNNLTKYYKWYVISQN
jgi:SAM-dependent methyltransferase